MNKIFLALCILSLGLGACSQQKKSDRRDSTAVIESPGVDNLEILTDSVLSQSVDTVVSHAKALFFDGSIFNAKGNIRKLEERVYSSSGKEEWSNTYLFDFKGQLLSVNGKKVKIKRDEEGRIKTLRYDFDYFAEDDGPQYMDYKYHYDDAGMVVSEDEDTGYSSGQYINTFDKEGRMIKRKYEDNLGGGEMISFTYPSSGIDAKGNWTKALRTVDGSTLTIKRKITYN